MIGVFDSGLGGLTILKEFLKTLPDYQYLYLGDNARAPYGDRKHEVIREYVEQSVKYLFNQGCTLIIFACNTASASVLRELQEEYLRKPNITDKKILGVIRPLAEYAAKNSRFGRVGIVGTRATINSKSYDQELKKLNPTIHVSSQACPLLVPLIEENWSHKPEAKMILKKYLRPLKNTNPDTVILGCTHYPFMHKEFSRILGKRVNVPSPGVIVADSLKDYLKRHPEIESKLTKSTTKENCIFKTTGDSEKFKEIGSRFLEKQISNVEKVILE